MMQVAPVATAVSRPDAMVAQANTLNATAPARAAMLW